jgi:hypothetical protein
MFFPPEKFSYMLIGLSRKSQYYAVPTSVGTEKGHPFFFDLDSTFTIPYSLPLYIVLPIL